MRLRSKLDHDQRMGWLARIQVVARSLLPFHSSWRVTARVIERQMTWRMTTRFGRSSHTTVVARDNTMGRTTA
jgi:hypothetical protein